MKGYNSNITIRIPNDKDVKVNITTESKSHIIHTSDIKRKSATELIKESVNEMDTLRIIKKYIENGRMSRLDFISSLNESIKKDYFVISELLINSSLDVVSYKDEKNRTFLHSASAKNLGICKLLIQRGADINAKTDSGNTPLHLAIIQNKIEVAELLMDKDANISFKNKDGYTPLQLCAMKNNLDLFISLLENGADPELKSDCGNNCLHLAVLNNSQNIVYRILKYHNMDINAKNDKGCSPIKLAKDKLIYNLLIENGAYAEVNIKISSQNLYSHKDLELYRILGLSLISLFIISFLYETLR
jgi:ankyrin repeat protein